MHLAIAPAGLLSSLAPDPAVALLAVERVGAAAAALAARAGAGLAAGAVAGAIAAAALIPPWPEHAPRPPLDIVPSVQLTIAAALADAFAGFAAGFTGVATVAAAVVAALVVFAGFVAFDAIPP